MTPFLMPTHWMDPLSSPMTNLFFFFGAEGSTTSVCRDDTGAPCRSSVFESSTTLCSSMVAIHADMMVGPVGVFCDAIESQNLAQTA